MSEVAIYDEATLIHRASDGDRECFGQLMENHARRAYRIAFSILQNQSDAEDVVQEACITAYKSIKKLQKADSFGSWLSRIVTTRAYDFLRKKQRERKAADAQTTKFKMDIAHSTSDRAENKHDARLDLQEAITRLPDPHRLVIMLRYAEDATAEEIAKTLNRPAGTIRRIMSESYRLLRLYIEGDKSA